MQISRQYSALAQAHGVRHRPLLSLCPISCSRELDRSARCLQSDQPSTGRRELQRAESQHSLHTSKRSAASFRRAVDTRTFVTKAAVLEAPAFGESDIWQWRKAQLRKIAMFTGPALSIPLADPIMSLVDTVCVGQVRC